jgi:hypothetical protein
MPVFLNVNSNKNATYSSLKHHSKRATSVGVVEIEKVTGDIAFHNKVWTGVTAGEHIVVEI